ncbi:MAG: rRNA maturation RNase YbeY [Chthoniobacterales bacterium]|nr:rRNA maturation RNase YbeY [Chthoniobacterales bacterium]
MIPKFLWFSRQRAVLINQAYIQSLVVAALPECLARPRYATSCLPSMIEVSFLNDRAIAKVHADFCNDPSSTDVITFRHSPELGEILIGVPTVVRHAKKFHQSVDHEIALCVIHGLLHLLDYDDINENERRLMHREQDFLLQYAVNVSKK